MPEPDQSQARTSTWFLTLRRYLLVTAALNLIWEFAQLPLYTLWSEATPASIVFSALHCTAGDILIAALTLVGAILILGNSKWPHERYVAVGVATVISGLLYTGYSEWVNVFVRKTWAYSEAMPRLPVLELGLSPVMQWIIIPISALRRVRPD